MLGGGVFGSVGSFSFNFQFFTRLATVFAEEVGDFSSSPLMAL